MPLRNRDEKTIRVQEKVATIAAPDVQIIFTRPLFIPNEQFLQDKNFRQYLEAIMVSKKILRMGVQKTPTQKTYEISIGSDSISSDFLGSNRQFYWLEISLVYSKSDKHTTIYDSCNAELAAKYIKSLKLSNLLPGAVTAVAQLP